jgi:hypothetical protein
MLLIGFPKRLEELTRRLHHDTQLVHPTKSLELCLMMARECHFDNMLVVQIAQIWAIAGNNLDEA